MPALYAALMSAPPVPSDTTLAAWTDWWIIARCGCGRRSDLPVRLLVRRIGGAVPLTRFAARLRCKACKARPQTVELTDDPRDGAKGFPSSGSTQHVPLSLP